MKYFCSIIIILFCNQQLVADTVNQWRGGGATDIRHLLHEASKLDGKPRLAFSELESFLGKHDYIESEKLMLPEKRVWLGGRKESTITVEFVWKLSKGRHLQVVVAESFVIYSWIIDSKSNRSLIWK